MHRLTPYAFPFGINEYLLEKAIGSVPESEATRRLSPTTNTLRGIAAHLTISRHGLCKSLGIEVKDLPWGDIGEMFEAGFKETPEFPKLETIRSVWKELSAALSANLLKVTDAALDRPSPFPLPGKPTATNLDFAALAVVHEGYHIGQLGLIVKSITGKAIMNP